MDFSQNFYGLRAMNSEFFEGDSCRLNFGVSVVLSVSTLWSPAIFFLDEKKPVFQSGFGFGTGSKHLKINRNPKHWKGYTSGNQT